jgi:hypothetical protein
MHIGFINGLFVPHNLETGHERPVPLLQFPMALRIKTRMSSGSKEKEPEYACPSEAEASRTMWAEVSSSAPHPLRKGLLISPIK